MVMKKQVSLNPISRSGIYESCRLLYFCSVHTESWAGGLSAGYRLTPFPRYFWIWRQILSFHSREFSTTIAFSPSKSFMPNPHIYRFHRIKISIFMYYKREPDFLFSLLEGQCGAAAEHKTRDREVSGWKLACAIWIFP